MKLFDTASLSGDTVRCENCSRTYMHRRSLWRHLKFQCDKPPRFQCNRDGCNFATYLKENLKKHFAK
nr:unnamed protein product [Callosobruchus analis]